MHTDLTETLKGARQTFLDIPAAVMPRAGSVAIFGAVHGTPYPDATNQEGETGPEAVRRAITAACVHLENRDFDFGGPLLNDGALEVIDLGDVVTDPRDAAANRENIERTTRAVLAAGAIPVLIGGDDSVAIPFMRGLGAAGPLHVLQIDAHIDWRDNIGDERLGYSSTMRRASELPFVASMMQVGIRAVGSARQAEVEAAEAWGSRLVTVSETRRLGLGTVIGGIPRDGAVLIHIDCDAMDPGTCPGVNAVSPGGFSFEEMTTLIAEALRGRRLAGFSIVEFQPRADISDISAIVVGRLVCHVLGHLARGALSP
ncbi:arginase family protein (plasmid) [Rhizobium sp. B230/85]|uniref:arginase family protein n=1 Tax=unclassified Rhizobium TaxID=2613769 RepID=UPI001ADC6A73|nr:MULTISPECIES: arginase family protein [unclassified Rhizobium]MBO9135902.1 arginase family protein [Rhizobium sp. B209b/85]QXZ99327.1 arginase family protein [Rhizobium sp. B230/85]